MQDLVCTRIGKTAENLFCKISDNVPSLDDIIRDDETKNVFDAYSAGALNALIVLYVFIVRLPALAALMYVVHLCKKMENSECEKELARGVPESELHRSSLGREVLDDE